MKNQKMFEEKRVVFLFVPTSLPEVGKGPEGEKKGPKERGATPEEVGQRMETAEGKMAELIDKEAQRFGLTCLPETVESGRLQFNLVDDSGRTVMSIDSDMGARAFHVVDRTTQENVVELKTGDLKSALAYLPKCNYVVSKDIGEMQSLTPDLGVMRVKMGTGHSFEFVNKENSATVFRVYVSPTRDFTLVKVDTNTEGHEVRVRPIAKAGRVAELNTPANLAEAMGRKPEMLARK